MTTLEIAKHAYTLLSRHRRFQLLWLLAGICATGLAELALATSVSLLGIALAAPDSLQKIGPLWKLFQMAPSFGNDLPQSIRMLILVLVLVCIATCIKNITTAIILYRQNCISQHIGWDMGAILFDKYLQAPYVWLTQHNPATLRTYLTWRLSVGFYLLGVLQIMSQAFILLLLLLGCLFVAPLTSLLLFSVAGLLPFFIG